MIANGYRFDFTSGCTLMGSPTPTGASCTETKSLHETSSITSATVVVPATGDDSTLGIFPATLIVTDTGDFPMPSIATETKASANSHVSTSDASLAAPATATATATPDPLSLASVGFLNSTGMITGAPTHFGNGTTVTVTVTVLASSIPCHCECDCRGSQTANATVTVPMAMKNHGAKTAAPVVLMCGMVVGAMFWI